MKGLTKILELRVKQGYRALASVGVILLLIGVPMIVILSLGIFAASEEGWHISLIFFAMVYGIHFSRPDKEHLIHLGFKPWLIFLVEYLALAIFLGVVNLLLVGNWMNLLIMLGIAIIVALSPQANFKSLRNGLHFPVGWIPNIAFEWRIGFRKYGWLVVMIIALGLIFSHRSPAVTLVAVILIGFLSTGWYKDFESFELFSVFQKSQNFISKKVLFQVALNSLISLPLYFFFLYFYSELWYLLLVAVLMGHAVNCFAIFYKYAGYHPSRFKTKSDLAVAIFALCALVPFFAPVILVYLGIYFFRARKNVKQFYAPC